MHHSKHAGITRSFSGAGLYGTGNDFIAGADSSHPVTRSASARDVVGPSLNDAGSTRSSPASGANVRPGSPRLNVVNVRDALQPPMGECSLRKRGV